MWGGDPCGRPRTRKESYPSNNLARRRQAGFLTGGVRKPAGAQLLLVLAVAPDAVDAFPVVERRDADQLPGFDGHVEYAFAKAVSQIIGIVQFYRHTPELARLRIAFALVQVTRLDVIAAHQGFQARSLVQRRMIHLLASALFDEAQQQRSDTAFAIVGVYTDEGMVLLVIAMAHTSKTDKLPLVVDNHPGIALQVEAMIPPVSL